MDDVFTDARMISPTLTDFWSGDELYKKRHLHISLSRPIYLRAHQREELKIAVKGLSKKFAPYAIEFSGLHEKTLTTRLDSLCLLLHFPNLSMTNEQEHS